MEKALEALRNNSEDLNTALTFWQQTDTPAAAADESATKAAGEAGTATEEVKKTGLS